MFQHIKQCHCNPPYKQTEEKYLMIISLDAEKAIDKIQHLHDNSLRDFKDTMYIPNIIKASYKKLKVNSKLNGENLKAMSLKSGTG